MKEKYILNEEDVENLSTEQRDDYNNFLNTVRDRGIVYQAQLEKFDKILQEQYKSHVLFNPNGLERYPEILAKNINNVVDAVVQVRNNVINGKFVFNQFDFRNIDDGLDVLKKFVEEYTQSYHYQNAIGHQDLEELLPRIEQLKNQLSQDINFYEGYYNEKSDAINNYRQKKEAYDKLSLFGKLTARINGKKKELMEAQQKKDHYSSVKIHTENKQPGAIVNPFQYDEYLEKQQPNQSNGGRHR